MAFLTENNFYLVTFKPTSAPEWGVLDHMPILSTDALGAIVSGQPLLIYVTSDVSGSFADTGYNGGSGASDTILATAEGPLPRTSWTGEGGPTHHWARLPDGGLAMWDGSQHVSRCNDNARALLAAFLAA